VTDPKEIKSTANSVDSTANVESDQQVNDAQSKTQQRKETRDVITPYAFEVAPHLLGSPLASPTRRAISILIDLGLVALLSGVSGILLALVIGLLFWRGANRLVKNKGSRAVIYSLRVLSTLLAVGAALVIVERIIEEATHTNYSATEIETEVQSEDAIKTVVFSGKYLLQGKRVIDQIERGECVPLNCWQALADQFTTDLVEIELQQDVTLQMINQFVEMTADKLEPQQAKILDEYVHASYTNKMNLYIENNPVIGGANMHENQTANEQKIDDVADIYAGVDNKTSRQPEYSLISWMKGIIADLGLGFGWAAAYFTGTMVLLNGQTVGKKLIGIKVIKLDGSTLNVWESFGRYGGYGAGLATGLLGFLQIFWDPNRQAIQDKISETLVIRNTTSTLPQKQDI
jgi:hypothetical protein